MHFKEILERWAEHVNFDPDQRSFNLLSSNYEFNRCGKTMKMIIDEYDPSGLLAVMYAKLRYREILSQCKVNLFELVEHPECANEYVNMWRMFNSAEIAEAEDCLIERFNALLSNIEGCPLIGSEEKTDAMKRIYDAVGDVCESLNKCRIEIYQKGIGAIQVSNISNCIHVFDTLAEALIFLESAPDMVYISFIRQYQSAAGYFAFFVKSNGTILSINDRVEENYIGQHQNSRNGSWQESKNFKLFPYDKIVQGFDGKDYKGYAVNYIVSKENVLLKEIGPDYYIPLLLAVLLLKNKLSHFDFESAEIVFTNALLPNSVLLSGSDNQSKELIPLTNSIIAAQHKDLNLYFTDDEVISGSVSEKFDRNGSWYKNRNQHLVELYSDGFHVDLTNLARYDKSRLLLDGNSSVIISEYVGSEEEMQAQAYRKVRSQLAKYIEMQMEHELESFGGPKAVDQWFVKMLMQKKELLIQKAAHMYYEICITKTRRNTEFSPYVISASKEYQVSVHKGEICPSLRGMVVVNEPKERIDSKQTYACPITGTIANVWILFSPQTYTNLKELFEVDTLPKILEGWILTSCINEYNGNSLLNNVDPVGDIQHILTYDGRREFKYRKSFYFAVGVSKRGLNRLLKEVPCA